MYTRIIFLLLAIAILSCKSYQENIMFRVDDKAPTEFNTQEAPFNYIIQPNDLLLIDIYTGKGEKLIDPDQHLEGNSGSFQPREIHYPVTHDGTVDLPMVGKVKLSGLTLQKSAEILQERFTTFYTDPYVLVRFVNKRVYVLGAIGTDATGQVIPLENDQVTVTEILALAGGLTRESKAGNIRLIRGDQVKLLDLTTFEGYKENNLVVLPGDIIYVEPVRRPFSEFLRENYAIFGLTTGIISLISLIISLK